MAWRIVDWKADYEDSRSLRLRTVTWVRIPVDTTSAGYIKLTKGKSRAAHLGAWRALQCLAAKGGHAGVIPYDIRMIAEKTRLPEAVFEVVIPRLVNEIGWLVEIDEHGSDILGPNGTEVVPKGTEVVPRGNKNALEGKGREGKGREASAKSRARAPDEIWEAVCEVFKLKKLSRTAKTRVGKVVRDLKVRGASAGEIRKRAERYRREWPNVTCTPEALEKHWDEFDASRTTKPMGRSQNAARVREGAEQYRNRGKVIDQDVGHRSET